ncbi:XK-related protein 9 [Heptranchias perlo]|uniref:XK-related protein 9 n=1 Tax=Heptranchias perlo TaxID=212740 RepID=UPI003559E114
METEEKFSKCDFLMTLAGFVLYLADIGSDFWVAVMFLREEHITWCVMVLTVTLVSALILQSFSWSWYKDDEKRQQATSERQNFRNDGCKSSCSYLVLHIFQLGMLVRFTEALVFGYKAAFKQENVHWNAIYAVTDLSMLRLFEAFLETAPQLVLQTFILLEYDNRDYIQYVSVIISCISISWATLDYYAALKKSLPTRQKLACGFPYVMYFFYKLLTLSAKILSITLMATLHIIAVAAYLCVLWLIMVIYVWRQKITFCTSRCQKLIYKTVVGIILVFTFFNIKDQNTRVLMALYYIFRIFETIIVLSLWWLLKGSTVGKNYDLPISITVGLSLVIGIICLKLYYRYCHPHIYSERTNDEDFNNSHTEPQLHRSHDEVDGCLPANSASKLNNISENCTMIHSTTPNPGRRNSRITHFLTFY